MQDCETAKQGSMDTLTKKELAKIINQEIGYSLRVSYNIVNNILECMQENLQAGKKVKIVRFGTFTPAKRAGRRGTSPKDGSPIWISSRTTVAFRPSRTLKEMVNAGASKEILPDRGGQ